MSLTNGTYYNLMYSMTFLAIVGINVYQIISNSQNQILFNKMTNEKQFPVFAT